MASRKRLKKNINKAIGVLFTDCLIYKLFVLDADQDAVDNVIIKLRNIQSEYICRISVTEGREVPGRVKEYYQKLKSDFAAHINQIGEEIGAL